MSKLINRLLLPLDGSEFSEQAVAPAISLAQTHNAEVVLFGCVSLDDLVSSGVETSPVAFTDSWSGKRDELLYRLGKILSKFEEAGVKGVVAWSSGRPVEKILDMREQKECDCIVMTSHGRKGLQRFFMGSVAEGVLRRSPCPVFLIPPTKG